MRLPLLPTLALALAVLLAGCAGDTTGGDDGAGPAPGASPSPPPQMSTAEAQSLLASAAAGMPDRFAADLTVSQAGASAPLATMRLLVDNATGTSYVEVQGDADALANLTGGTGGAGQLLGDGFSAYVTPQGGLYLVNGTAVVFPPHDEGAGGPKGGPRGLAGPREGPLGRVLSGDEVLAGLGGANLTVTSVKPTTYRNRAAVEVQATVGDAGETRDVKAVVFTQTRRLAAIEGDLEADAASGGEAFAGGRMRGEFYYDDEVTLEVPEAATRALGLAYASDAAPFSFERQSRVTWTFRQDGGVPLTEVEAQVKSSDADVRQEGGLGAMSTLWRMRLSEGTMTRDDLTLTYTDADGDGLVSAGDTLVIEVAGEADLPLVVLYDSRTSTHVVPGPGALLAALGAAAAAALLAGARRRA